MHLKLVKHIWNLVIPDKKMFLFIHYFNIYHPKAISIVLLETMGWPTGCLFNTPSIYLWMQLTELVRSILLYI